MAPKTIDPVVAARSALGVAVRRGRDQAPARRALTTAKLSRAIDDALTDDYAPTAAARAELADRLIGGAR